MKRLIMATALVVTLTTPTPSHACLAELDLFLADVGRAVDRLIYGAPPAYRVVYQSRRARRK